MYVSGYLYSTFTEALKDALMEWVFNWWKRLHAVLKLLHG